MAKREAAAEEEPLAPTAAWERGREARTARAAPPPRLARAEDRAPSLGVRRAAGLHREVHDEVGAGRVGVHEGGPHGAAADGGADEGRGLVGALEGELLDALDVDAAGLVLVQLQVVVLRLQEVPECVVGRW